MALNLKEVAKKATNESEVMNGREKVELDGLVIAYPNGLSIGMCELAHTTDEKTGTQKDFCRVVFTEEPTKYVNGGAALTKIVLAWLDLTGGNIEEVNNELKASPVKVKFERVRLKNGNNYTVVNVL